MKRYGNLYEKIYDIDNLKLAFNNAKHDKSRYGAVKKVESNKEFYLTNIQNMLISKTYHTGDYKISTIWDKTKERKIYKLPFYPDRITHWAIMQVIEPYILNKLTINTFSAIPNRGITFGLERVREALKDVENTTFCLKFDIRHYYPSINHTILKNQYKRIFKDDDLLWLLFEIIDSIEMDADTGVPIGNYLSQWDGILYLNDFTHWLKEEKHCKYVFIYMDDVVILSNSKEELHQLFGEIKVYLRDNLKLTIKNNHQVFPVDVREIDFMGYRIFRDYVLLRKSTSKNLKRKMNKICKNLKNGYRLTYLEWCSIHGYGGWLEWCNGYNLYLKYIKPLEPYAQKYYREVIKHESI